MIEPVELVIYSIAMRQEETVVTVEGMDDTPPLWLDNDRYLLVRLANGSLQKVDLTTRRTLPLESAAHSRLPVECGSHALAANGRTLYLAVQNSPEIRRVVAFDTTTGEQKDVLAAQAIAELGVLAVSPDEKLLALAVRRQDSKDSHLVLFDLEHGNVRELAEATGPRTASWSRSGLFVSLSRGARSEVMRVAIAEGSVSATGLILASGQFFAVNPAGNRVVLSDRTRSDEQELWAYENLLPYLNSIH